MVQFFQTGPSRGGRIAEMLGQSLGGGLSNFLNTYYANQDIEKVLNDPTLKNAPASERLGRLESALRPHGDLGKQIFQNRLGIEKSAMEEKELKRKERQEAREERRLNIQEQQKVQELQLKERDIATKEAAEGRKQKQFEQLQNILGVQDIPQQALDVSKPTSQGNIPLPKSPISTMDIDPNKIAALSLVNPQAATALSNIQNTAYNKFKDVRDFNYQRAKPAIEANDAFLEKLPSLERDVDTMEDAILSGNTSGFKSYLVDLTGQEYLRNVDEAALKTAVKDLFLNNVQKAGSRPNQWVEQQIAAALPQLGRSVPAGMVVVSGIRADLDIRKKRAEILGQLENYFSEQNGYIPGDISKRADEIVKPYADKRKMKLSYDTRKIREQERPELISEHKPVPQGTALTLEKARKLIEDFGDNAEKVAKKLGYDFVEEDIYSGKFK